jgi:FG-GAP repeat protein/VCBS repeat protein
MRFARGTKIARATLTLKSMRNTYTVLPLLISATILVLTGTTYAQTVGGGFDLLHHWDGWAANDGFGKSVSGAGDVNGDGFNDIIVGAPDGSTGGVAAPGSVYVYSGEDGSQLYRWDGGASADAFGISVAGAGDVNLDGFDDLVVGAASASPNGVSRAGSTYVYSGADGALLYQWNGRMAEDFFGRAVAAAGDVNRDGYADIIVGTFLADPGGVVLAGSAYVYSGLDGSLIYQWDGHAAIDYFGFSVSGAGDVNGDGFDDLIVGAPQTDPRGMTDAGSAYVYSGADGSLLYQWNGQAAGDIFGFSVSKAGDLNGDGFSDLIVGARWADPGGLVAAGSAYVYSGADGSLLYLTHGKVKGAQFGNSVSSAGDFNGDGITDVVVGAIRTETTGTLDPWSAFIYSGTDGSLLYQATSDPIYFNLGVTVSGAGDLNGDGYDDVVVGSNWGSSVETFGFRPFATATDDQISITTGGAIDYQIDFPDHSAGYAYKVLVSRSGIGPSHFGVDIPLTYDSLVERTWMGSYPGASKGHMLGTLDAEGKAVATIKIAAGNWSELVGLDCYLAVVAIPAGSKPEFSSVALSLTITP